MHRVVEKRWETEETVTLTLAPQQSPGIACLPGQFNMLYAFGVGEIPISFSGPPGADQPLVHTIRQVGPVSAALCNLPVGASVGVRGPFGTPWPLEEAVGSAVLVMAGGVGIAPLRTALRQLIQDAARYTSLTLLYGARSPAQLLFGEERARWSADDSPLQVLTTVDHATAPWRGRVGVVPQLLEAIELDGAPLSVFLCGPEVMMRYSIRALEDRGVAASQIYLTMERNMKCATGFCGHCLFGPVFVCRDGAVFRYDRIAPFFRQRHF
jgi:NAD(P)H-flavin reductase